MRYKLRIARKSKNKKKSLNCEIKSCNHFFILFFIPWQKKNFHSFLYCIYNWNLKVNNNQYDCNGLPFLLFSSAWWSAVMRLVEGIDACSGRVEVLHDGKWGTVCDDDWGASDGAVVCKEMGCGNIKALTYGAYFGATSGQIWMDNVNCTGEEAALSTCAFQGWGTHNCLFAKHAGVMCGRELQIVNSS